MTDLRADTIRRALDAGLLRHTTRRGTRYGENNAWDVDVHTPDDCLRCDAEAAVDGLLADAARLEAEAERLYNVDVMEALDRAQAAEARVSALETAGRAVVEANYATSGADIAGKAPLWAAIDALHVALGEWEPTELSEAQAAYQAAVDDPDAPQSRIVFAERDLAEAEAAVEEQA